MNVLRHNHVTHDDKLMALADLFHNFEEEIAGLVRVEQGTPLAATGSDEVEMSRPIIAVKICWHADGVAQSRGFGCDE